MSDTAASISSAVMQKLGLDAQTVQKVQEERSKKEQAAEICYKNGWAVYRQMAEHSELSLSLINLVSENIPIGPVDKAADLPAAINNKVSELKSSGKFEAIEKQLMEFVRGFGESALDALDLKVAIACLDFVSDGGILNNAAAIDKIKSKTFGNVEKLVEAGEIIESLGKGKSGNSADQISAGLDLRQDVPNLNRADDPLPENTNQTATPIQPAPEPTPQVQTPPTSTPGFQPQPAMQTPQPTPPQPSTAPIPSIHIAQPTVDTQPPIINDPLTANGISTSSQNPYIDGQTLRPAPPPPAID